MNLERLLTLQNAILQGALGNAPSSGGQPQLKWLHSSDPATFLTVQEIDKAGQPVWDEQCPCGWNRSIHLPYCKGAFNRAPKFIQVPSIPWLRNQVSLYRWCAFPSEVEWKATFGNRAVYKPEGQYLFMFSLDPGELPTHDLTVMVAGMIREHDEMAKSGKLFEWLDQRQASRDKSRSEKMLGIINDTLPAFDGEFDKHGDRKRGSNGTWVMNAAQEKAVQELIESASTIVSHELQLADHENRKDLLKPCPPLPTSQPSK